jgi:hypothetical protein
MGVLLVALGGTAAKAATDGGPTRGDAQAAFEAFFTGGFAIRAHNPLAHGAPGTPAVIPPNTARIYPLEDDLEYCADGWHVVVLGFFDDPAVYPGGRKEVVHYLSAVDVQFALDGIPVTTERTQIRRFPHLTQTSPRTPS